ncbi:hypothetical protein EP837_03419 [Sphingobium sp. EP60837]|uniref:hypothetical protein n=1 Tax=Sphingobium tyrosinilyticum TaxID=2715436 RepID=UPI0007DD36C7|nr:hypothetical protein EP837_03419 [Sphingobium sp. EP60837]
MVRFFGSDVKPINPQMLAIQDQGFLPLPPPLLFPPPLLLPPPVEVLPVLVPPADELVLLVLVVLLLVEELPPVLEVLLAELEDAVPAEEANRAT